MFQVHFVHLTTEHQSSAVQHTVDCAGWELWICDAVQYHVSEWYYILLAHTQKKNQCSIWGIVLQNLYHLSVPLI